MLLELAIGDAYGMGFEYALTELVTAANNLSHYTNTAGTAMITCIS
jgi:hypothetical protein